jgi:hypothetical protein
VGIRLVEIRGVGLREGQAREVRRGRVGRMMSGRIGVDKRIWMEVMRLIPCPVVRVGNQRVRRASRCDVWVIMGDRSFII